MNFSIVIAAYNQAEYLPQAIESALDQTVPSEVIVVNDGSTDDTRKVAEKYPVKLINQVNKGLASARNTGIMNALGDVIFPLDSDDVLLTHCVERMMEKFEETNADVVAPSMRTFGESEQNIIILENPKLSDFRIANRIPYASAIKKQALLECGGYSSKMDQLGGFEDYHLWFDLLLRGKIIVGIQEILFLYRTKKESMYTRAEKNRAMLMEQIFKDFPQILPRDIAYEKERNGTALWSS